MKTPTGNKRLFGHASVKSPIAWCQYRGKFFLIATSRIETSITDEIPSPYRTGAPLYTHNMLNHVGIEETTHRHERLYKTLPHQPGRGSDRGFLPLQKCLNRDRALPKYQATLLLPLKYLVLQRTLEYYVWFFPQESSSQALPDLPAMFL